MSDQTALTKAADKIYDELAYFLGPDQWERTEKELWKIIQRLLDERKASSDAESHNRLLTDMDTELDESQEWESKSYQEFWPQRDGMRWRTRAVMAEKEIEWLRGLLADADSFLIELEVEWRDLYLEVEWLDLHSCEEKLKELAELRRQIAETNQENGNPDKDISSGQIKSSPTVDGMLDSLKKPWSN